jgi:transcriptional regulator with XRE-family HTH domain
MHLFFGKNLKFLRKQKDLNQAELGEIVSKGGNTIGNWENGNAEPNFQEATEIVNFFGISIFDMLYVDLERAHLIESEKGGKKGGKSTPIHAPNRTPNRANEPFVDYGKPKNSDTLISTLTELVESKNEIIADLKGKITDLKNALNECEKKNPKHKEAGHA